MRSFSLLVILAGGLSIILVMNPGLSGWGHCALFALYCCLVGAIMVRLLKTETLRRILRLPGMQDGHH